MFSCSHLFSSFFGAKALHALSLNGSAHCKLMLNKYFTERLATLSRSWHAVRSHTRLEYQSWELLPGHAGLWASGTAQMFHPLPPLHTLNTEAEAEAGCCTAAGISASKGRRQAGVRDFCGIKHTQKLRTALTNWYFCLVWSVKRRVKQREGGCESAALTQAWRFRCRASVCKLMELAVMRYFCL